MSRRAAGPKQPSLTLTGNDLVEILEIVGRSDLDLAAMLAQSAGITDPADLRFISLGER